MKRLLCTLCVLLLLPLTALAEDDVLRYGEPPAGFDGLEVRFLDIAAGDSIYLRCGDETMLVDGGVKLDGRRSLAYFASQGVTGVTYMLNTHSHGDHTNGLIELLKGGFTATQVLSPYSVKKKEPLFISLLKLVNKLNIPYQKVNDGESMSLGGATVQFIRCMDDSAMKSRNENSLVLRIQYGERSILLPADIGGSPQRLLAKQYGDALRSDVVKSAHHGIARFVDEWLAAVQPRFVVCTGHSKEAQPFINQIADLGLPMLFAPDGVVHLVTDGSVWYIWQTGHMTKEDEAQVIYPARGFHPLAGMQGV